MSTSTYSGTAESGQQVVASGEQRLAATLRDARISLAMKGRWGSYLPPEDWEEVRQRLQAVYRRATGEIHATLGVELAP